jgi:replication factor C subunit 3/5
MKNKKNNKSVITNEKNDENSLIDNDKLIDNNIYDENNLEIEFLVDKYIPSNISDIIDPVYEYYDELEFEKKKSNTDWKLQSPSKCYFHKEILEKLKTISIDDGMPHIIFYGNPGSGKKTLINLFLEMIFDKSVYNLDDSKYTVISSGNIENEVIVKQSDHHIIIEPNNNNFDRYLIQDIVKEYARRYPLCIFEKSRNFKMVQINNLDNLSYYAQTSLRRTIEKYSKTCRFIMWCYSLSKVIEPLRSRCLCIHVPTQTTDELVKWTFNIGSLESINLNLRTLTNIVNSSGGNLKNILWKLDMYKYCGKITNCYQKALDNLIEEIMTTHNIEIIRDYVYKMMITNISSNIIIKDILNIILVKINGYPKDKIFKIIDAASTFEYRLSKGRRDIIHIETFLETVINILK